MMPTVQMPEAYEDLIQQLKEMGEEYLAGVASALKTKGIDCETVVEVGRVVERIIHTAETHHADLIALASHGRTGLAQVFFGSVASGVLHRSQFPLLLIRSLGSE